MCVARAPSVLTNMFDLGSESQGLDVQTNVMHCGVVDKVGFLTFCRYLWQGSIIAASTCYTTPDFRLNKYSLPNFIGTN